jgi:two-component system CheB/CheR fusion protein
MESAESKIAGLQKQLTAERGAAQRGEQRRNEFLAMLSHELRNPLAAILNALQLCDVPNADETTFEWSRIIMRRQLTHLTHLVDDLLDVAGIAGGKIQLRSADIDLADVLDSALAGLRPLFLKRRHELDASYPQGELFVSADRERLEQVFMNLLTNAARYTEPGGRIAVSAQRDGDEAVVVVRDNGVGVAPEALADIFELFAQGPRARAHPEGGLGLGLTIARTLVELHGGRISARSGEGGGAEFIVHLPAVAATPFRVEQAPPARQHLMRRRPARILVVDDHTDTAVSLARLLRAGGDAVEIAHDGRTAVDIAAIFHPQVVLLDLGLPGMDGYAVAEHLRSQAKGERTTIIAISGYGQEEDRRRSQEAGIDHHLVKPVSFEQLDELLASATAATAAVDD